VSMYSSPDKYALDRMKFHASMQQKKRDIQFKFRAACRALGICNKLKPGACKAKNNLRIMKALRELRKALRAFV
jgi:hypothetical protein